MKDKQQIHPAIKELKIDLDNGKLSRRGFLRYATLLGMSAAAASQMAGLAWPKNVFAQGVKRGGSIKISSPVHKVTHPAQFTWIAPSQTPLLL